MTENFVDPNHALRAGMLWGILMRSGLDALPEVDDLGNYTDIIEIAYEDRTYRVQVLPQ